jgi:hypothetical protein
LKDRGLAIIGHGVFISNGKNKALGLL